MSFLSILSRLLSGILGGALGTLFMLIIYLFSQYFLGNSVNPLTDFIVIIMIFIGSLVANLGVGIFLTMTQSEKYSRKSSMLWQAFIANLFLLLVAFPFYTLMNDIHAIALFHILTAAFITNVIYEIFTVKNAYALTGLYGSVFASFILFVSAGLLDTTTDVFSILLFSILPLIWFIFISFTLITESLYRLFYSVYGQTFFNIHND